MTDPLDRLLSKGREISEHAYRPAGHEPDALRLVRERITMALQPAPDCPHPPGYHWLGDPGSWL